MSVLDQEDSAHQPASDRFVSRPSPKRGRHRVVLESDQVSSLSGDDNQDTRTSNVGKHQKSLKQRLRKSKINPFSNSINNIDDEHDEGCNNPFDCPPRFKVAAGRRPRVKANLRARKRNFWHKNSVGSGDSSDIGHGFRRGRKIRRGRKQITDVIGNADIESDIQEAQTDDTVNETTEQFVPTTRTTTEREATTTQAVKVEENEIFDDFFDHENDFFAASSTISPVVFKGSPGPGFFSSPRPFYDNEGNQV